MFENKPDKIRKTAVTNRDLLFCSERIFVPCMRNKVKNLFSVRQIIYFLVQICRDTINRNLTSEDQKSLDFSLRCHKSVLDKILLFLCQHSDKFFQYLTE